MRKLRYRQVHLDFHTSPQIPGIGEKFNKRQWQETLKRGHVNSITAFAVCHHGWSYNDTKVGERHPHLNFDLLRAQFDASKEIDVNVPIYITAGISNRVAYEHPEWREITPEGKYASWEPSPIKAGYHNLCFNTPYLNHLCELIDEVVQQFPDCDGIFLDIISQSPCCCRWCIDDMLAAGLDPLKHEDRAANAKRVLTEYYKRSNAAAQAYNKNMPVFHNSGHIAKGDREVISFQSHLELESLPTGGWGYDHFPVSAKYALGVDKEVLGMTGKFHTTWGEFGGFKHPNALRYECAAMIAYGSKCSVGDQLHPNGKLNTSTYDLIGAAYSEVEAKEPWCDNVVSGAEVAFVSAEAAGASGREPSADTGTARVLLEGHIPFDVLDTDMEFNNYKVLILPDEIRVTPALKKKVDSFLSSGGKLIMSGSSGISEDGTKFLFDTGAKLEGDSPFCPDYIMPKRAYAPDYVKAPLVMYLNSKRIKATTGKSLGDIYDPWFNRAYNHFCSHQHTPYTGEPSGYDCGVINDKILYFAHPVFSLYHACGAVPLKDYILKVIRKFIGTAAVVETSLPSTARVSVMDQPDEKRRIVHLLYATTINRGGNLKLENVQSSGHLRSVEVIEELLPLYNVDVKVRSPRKVKSVTLEPQGKAIEFSQKGSWVSFKVDEFTCHQMVVLA
ncbi:MAG: hypothetical protein GX804_06550 [Lentisphaerae bacterium]|jgi:hypothetical protein|nr:hypothetical protein [Lentisphaerota bacterium]